MSTTNSNSKSFWSKPEGKTGGIFLIAMMALAGWAIFTFGTALATFAGWIVGKVVLIGVLGLIIYAAIDPKTRALVSYMYQSMMRKITGLFITIDPVGILKNYISDLEGNLRKMGKRIGDLKGQARKLKTMVSENNKEIEKNIIIAKKAKEQGNQKAMLLSTRKAARLKDTNGKYIALHSKISVLYKVLTKMYSNSEILLEDTKDQVRVKEQERKAIRASHSAMKSAMSVIKGDPDKRAMFDQAMEHMADDVANKIGEMEQFMEMSSDFMDSIDLQNGVFEEKGLKMLEEYEKKSTLLLLGGQEQIDEDTLELKEMDIQTREIDNSGYEGMFD
jgi:phage shock protein A